MPIRGSDQQCPSITWNSSVWKLCENLSQHYDSGDHSGENSNSEYTEDDDEDTPEIIYTHKHLDESHFSNSFLVFAQLRDENILTDIILKG